MEESLGCASSHISFLEKFIESGNEYCAILEDNAKVVDADISNIDKLKTETKISEFDLLYLTQRIKHNKIKHRRGEELIQTNRLQIAMTNPGYKPLFNLQTLNLKNPNP